MSSTKKPLFGSFGKLLGGGSRVQLAKRFDLLDKGIKSEASIFHRAKEKETGKVVGLKIIDAKKTAEADAKNKGIEKPPEGEIAAQLQHPNIVETYEHGTAADGSPFVVMEYIDGPTLGRMLDTHDKGLSGRRRKFLMQAAEAIQAVHNAGFIHRDICPQNFMVTKDGQMKLIDFGTTTPDSRVFTQPGQRFGRRNYSAPEVIARRKVDKRIDVFSFGIMAYRLCSLAYPWEEAHMSRMLLNNQKGASILEICPRMSPTLAEAIHFCIEPDHDERCSSMEAFMEKLQGVVPQ